LPDFELKTLQFFMLFENTVAPTALALLKELMQMEALKPVALAGGTNLSLRVGHHISDDLDIVLHRYPYLHPFETIEDIRFASIPDIVAMKLNAISRRGVKKDYFDFAELLNHYTLPQMLEFFTHKYTATDIGFVVRSFVYFEDADRSKDPIMLKKISWNQAKHNIEKAVHEYWKSSKPI
jgi:Nucleotidyl transferase AbiEii toxin, Type IV TA system